VTDKGKARLIFIIYFAQIIIGGNNAVRQLRIGCFFNLCTDTNDLLVRGDQLLQLFYLSLLLF